MGGVIKIEIYKNIIKDKGIVHDLDENLITAIILQESGGNSYAIRYEPLFRYRYYLKKFAKLNNISHDTENILQACSIGLMQVMGCVARELEFKENLLMLTQPEIGIEYGCKKLKSLFLKHDDLEDVIASYNSGSPLFNRDGTYKNQNYVDDVLKKMRSQNE